MKRTALFPLGLVLASLCGATLYAATPIGGLTVAVSPDGTRLVAGGDTRTVIVLDPQSLEVSHREWIERPIIALAFSKDGKTLAVQDTDDHLLFFDSSDWSVRATIPKRIGFAVSTEADLVAGHDGNSNGPTIFVHSLSDGAERFSTTLEKGVRIAGLAVNNAGSRLAVLTEATKDEEEPEVPSSEVPKDLRGLELETFKQKNDGKTSRIHYFDLPSGQALETAKTFYATNAGGTLFFDGDDLVSVNYTNLNARISPQGETSLFQLQNSFNYGIGRSQDGRLILTGGLAQQSVTQTTDLSAQVNKIEKLPAWPEYWKGFTSVSGEVIYGATTAYRVFKLDASGQVVTSAPVS